jgi:hypothetical protein
MNRNKIPALVLALGTVFAIGTQTVEAAVTAPVKSAQSAVKAPAQKHPGVRKEAKPTMRMPAKHATVRAKAPVAPVKSAAKTVPIAKTVSAK